MRLDDDDDDCLLKQHIDFSFSEDRGLYATASCLFHLSFF